MYDMLNNQKDCRRSPAYNAALILKKETYDEIPKWVVDDIILTDDSSADETISLAKSLGIHTLVHDANRGYGGNRKTCYRVALESGGPTSWSCCTRTTNIRRALCPRWRRWCGRRR